MKIRNIFSLLFAAVAALAGLSSCGDDGKEGKDNKEITGYEEYTVTVASRKILGPVPSGHNELGEVIAVKKEGSMQWTAISKIGGFRYEPGNEYRLRISETRYLDFSASTPAWTEFELLEELSKERKDTDNLPLNIIPNSYFRNYCPQIDNDFSFVVSADNKDEIENDLKTDEAYRFSGMRCFMALAYDRWFMTDADTVTRAQGRLTREKKESKDFPETYKLLPVNSNIMASGHFKFEKGDGLEIKDMEYDVFIASGIPVKADNRPATVMWMYKDLTAYYRGKYPAANISAVVIRYAVKS